MHLEHVMEWDSEGTSLTLLLWLWRSKGFEMRIWMFISRISAWIPRQYLHYTLDTTVIQE